jgi:hypothetical protein
VHIALKLELLGYMSNPNFSFVNDTFLM